MSLMFNSLVYFCLLQKCWQELAVSVITVTATGTASPPLLCLFATVPPPPPRWRSVLVTVLLGNVSPLLRQRVFVFRKSLLAN